MKKDEKGFRDIIVGSLTKTTGQVRKRIEPWLDPPDRTIVGSKGSNHGWILRIEQLLDPKDRTMVGSSGSNNCWIQRIEP